MFDTLSVMTLPLATADFRWVSIFLMSGSIGLCMGAMIMATVWLTGGFQHRS